MSPAINSARPDHLQAYGTDLQAAADRSRVTASDAARALAAYLNACIDARVAVRAPLLADSTLARASRLAVSTGQVGESFARADRSTAAGDPVISGQTVGPVDDIALSTTIVARFPGLAHGTLLSPLTRGGEEGRAIGEEILALTRREGIVELVALLNSLSDTDLANPNFAVGLISGFTPEELTSAVETLVDALSSNRPGSHAATAALVRLASLHAAATRTLDGPIVPWRMDQSLGEGMVSTTTGRDAIRVLAGLSRQPLGTSYLHLVVPATLLQRSSADEDRTYVSRTASWLSGQGSRGDAPMFSAVARNGRFTVDLLTGPGAERRIATLLARSRGEAQTHLNTMVITGLSAPQLANAADGTRTAARDAFLRPLVDGIAAGLPGGLEAPLAITMAGTLATDMAYYEGRAASLGAGGLKEYFSALVRHGPAFRTALSGFDQVVTERLAGSLNRPTDIRLLRFVDLKTTLRIFTDATMDADIDQTQVSPMVGVTEAATEAGLSLVTIKGGPAARVVVKHLVDAGFNRVNSVLTGPEREQAYDIEVYRTGVRRDIWSLIAEDPELGPLLSFDLPAGRSGTEIKGVADLGALGWGTADVDAFAAWSAGQPEPLQSLVADYVDILDLNE